MFFARHGRGVTSASDLPTASACEVSWLRRLEEWLGVVAPAERTDRGT